ncbi:hypothetical protein GIB67_020763 [Kingdonia uniflora]|uniref:Uncharacterized protein n=1 Tax=Kingdonia uniflora TaxID=39325 RepID=A0A7J7M791_9MAGN|nr:hypothetical protein GIB67_020763 [Kingdonia uniflora]
MALIFFHPTLTPTPTPAYSSPLNNKTLIISSSCKPHFHFSPKSLFFCPKFTCRDATITNPNSETPVDSDWINADHERLVLESPWEGAITYKRNASITHVEYCTTLERLGLGTFSTGVSKTRSSAMGIRVTKGVKDYPLGTPVQVSIDVIRRKHRLRLDGIVRTVLTLGCNR